MTLLLSHLQPGRYRKAERAERQQVNAPPPQMREASLRAMEPQLTVPPEKMLDAATFEH